MVGQNISESSDRRSPFDADEQEMGDETDEEGNDEDEPSTACSSASSL